MDDDFVAVRVLDHRHAANRTLDVFGIKRDLRCLEVFDRSLEIVDLQRDAGAVGRWFPLIAHASDSKRAVREFVCEPDSLIEFGRWFETEDAFVKLSRPFDVRHWNSNERNVFDFHFGFAAATAFCAASARSSAVINSTPLSFSICFPFLTFVPSSRTTSGTDRCTVLAALIIPCAITSFFMIPPKMLTRIALTFLSAIRILNASVTCSSSALPPTSRKLAGLPP